MRLPIETKGEYEWSLVTIDIVQNMFEVPYPVLALEHLWLLWIIIQTQNARTYSPYPDNQRCSSAKSGYGTSNMLKLIWSTEFYQILPWKIEQKIQTISHCVLEIKW